MVPFSRGLPTLSFMFSSAILLISNCSRLHSVITLFISGSSGAPPLGLAAAMEDKGPSDLAEFSTGGALVASTSFCSGGEGVWQRQR